MPFSQTTYLIFRKHVRYVPAYRDSWWPQLSKCSSCHQPHTHLCVSFKVGGGVHPLAHLFGILQQEAQASSFSGIHILPLSPYLVWHLKYPLTLAQVNFQKPSPWSTGAHIRHTGQQSPTCSDCLIMVPGSSNQKAKTIPALK